MSVVPGGKAAKQERAEQERAEQKRAEQERAEQERAEQKRVEQERAQQERAAREKDNADRKQLVAIIISVAGTFLARNSHFPQGTNL